MKKNIVILGSNTSLGIKIIEFFLKYSNKYQIIGLTYDYTLDNLDLFSKQIKEIHPKSVYFDRLEDYKLIIEENISDEIAFYSQEESFVTFIKSTDISGVVSCLRERSSIKKILSSIHEHKDITILDSAPILYSGSIIIQEAKSRGVSLNVFTYQIFSLAQFLKARKVSDIYAIDIFSSKHNDTIKDIDSNDYKSYFEFMKKYHSINKTKTLFEAYLVNYIYNIPINQISFYEQNKPVISIAVKFKDGSNLLNMTSRNFESIFNYYFLDTDLLINQKYITYDSLTLSVNKIDINKYKLLELGITALERGGSIPILFYIVLDKLTTMIYNNNLKKGTDIIKVTEEIIKDKELYTKKPDLSLIYAFEKIISEKLNEKYSIKQKEKKL